MVRLLSELLVRVVLVTGAISIVAYLVIDRGDLSLGQLEVAIPLLFALFGVVMFVHLWFSLWKYRLLDAKYPPNSQ